MTQTTNGRLGGIALVLACVGASAAPRPVAPIGERRVDPSATSAGISNTFGQHFIAVPDSAHRGDKLLVFLPGTNGRPNFYTTFLRHAAQAGHYAIGLAYPNAPAVNRACATARSRTCQEDVRVEVITGTPRSDLVRVDTTNSIDNRVRALLTWLDRTYPAEQWSRFLTNGAPRWDRIAVAGHSQGGGHAAMIARQRVVRRAILFSATEPAPWTMASFATPKDRLYGFAHHAESAYRGITASWQSMGFSGAITMVDGATPPFSGSHRLETTSTACRQRAPLDPQHNCVVTDGLTPLGSGGQPLFGAVWTYLLDG